MQSVTLDRANYHNFEFIFKKDAKAKTTKDGVTLYDFENTYYPSEDLQVCMFGKQALGADFTAVLDWVYTRKYALPEPTSTLGIEEEAPPSGSFSSICAKLIAIDAI